MSNVTNNRNRIGYFDVLRGIGIILMVMGHVGFGDVFSKYIHAFHMPIFFFVAGYFYCPDKFKSVWAYIAHEAKTLLIPYFVFVVICQPLHYIYTHEFDFVYFIKSLLSSNHNRIDVSGVYWFLLCLFVAKIIFYVLEHRLTNKKLFVMCMILSLIGNVLPFDLPLCLDSALSCLLIIYVGFYLRNNQPKKCIQSIFSLTAWKITVLFVINIILILLNGMVNIRTNKYSFVPLFWLNCLMAIIVWLSISIQIDKAKSKMLVKISGCLKYIGRNSLVYLLINEIAIFLVAMIIKFTKIASISFWLEHIIIFVGTMIVLTFASEIFNRTKLKVLLGKY